MGAAAIGGRDVGGGRATAAAAAVSPTGGIGGREFGGGSADGGGRIIDPVDLGVEGTTVGGGNACAKENESGEYDR